MTARAIWKLQKHKEVMTTQLSTSSIPTLQKETSPSQERRSSQVEKFTDHSSVQMH
jgi:hypothetical protein